MKVRRDHHIVLVAVIIAFGVNTDGRPEVPGMTVGHSEAEPFWIDFLPVLCSTRHHGERFFRPPIDDQNGIRMGLPHAQR